MFVVYNSLIKNSTDEKE